MSKKLSYVAAILTIAAFIVFIVLRQTSDFNIGAFDSYGYLITTGIKNTILVSVISLLGSLVMGFIFYLLSISKMKYFIALVDVFTEIIYGTPLLVLIIVMAFLIGPAFGSYNRNLLGVIALIVYMTPYMKNVYKSAFSSISRDQYMAMDLFRFTLFKDTGISLFLKL